MKNHARHILQGLYAARQLVKQEFKCGGSPPPPLWNRISGFIPSDIADPSLHKLAEIESAVVRYSWLKICKRFRKANRHTAFFSVHDAILVRMPKMPPHGGHWRRSMVGHRRTTFVRSSCFWVMSSMSWRHCSSR